MRCGFERVAVWIRVAGNMFGMTFKNVGEIGVRQPEKSQFVEAFSEGSKK